MSDLRFPEALQRCAGDMDILKTSAQIIANDLPVELQKLDQSLAASDAPAAAGHAHAIKGMLGTFEQGAAVKGMQSVESAAKSGDIQAANASLQACRSAVQQLNDDIATFAEP